MSKESTPFSESQAFAPCGDSDYSMVSDSGRDSRECSYPPGPSEVRYPEGLVSEGFTCESSETSTVGLSQSEGPNARELASHIAKKKPDLATWLPSWEEPHPSTWIKEPEAIKGMLNIAKVKAELLVEFPPTVRVNENVPADQGIVVRVCPRPNTHKYRDTAMFLSLRIYDDVEESIPRVPDHTIQPIRFEREGLMCATYDRKEFSSTEDNEAVYFLLDEIVFPKEGRFKFFIDVGIEDKDLEYVKDVGWVKKNKYLGQLEVKGRMEVTSTAKGKGNEEEYRSKCTLTPELDEVKYADQQRPQTVSEQLALIKKIQDLPKLEVEKERLPYPLQENKHAKRKTPERVPDRRIWQKDGNGFSVEDQGPDEWSLDPPAVRKLWEDIKERMRTMTESDRAKELQKIAEKALKRYWSNVKLKESDN
ncbi:hypothetical protein B0T20DRAFT_52261 [Sordaria brevicollis]|uniref:Uncharacterized protein n=1 Tax=Sordaria brevicollis TaxID=83679 RepID=A0AAE0P2N7_SORBR|nr:hypothetical protein B0T20DRAFT_52261 [Sordaria brevicollis]